MNEFNNCNLPGIEHYAKDVKEVKVHILKKHTSALGNKIEEEAYTIRRGTPILDKINCANPTCTSYFSIRSCIIDAVLKRMVKEYYFRCEGKEDPSRKKNKGDSCDTTLKLVVSPLFSKGE